MFAVLEPVQDSYPWIERVLQRLLLCPYHIEYLESYDRRDAYMHLINDALDRLLLNEHGVYPNFAGMPSASVCSSGTVLICVRVTLRSEVCFLNMCQGHCQRMALAVAELLAFALSLVAHGCGLWTPIVVAHHWFLPVSDYELKTDDLLEVKLSRAEIVQMEIKVAQYESMLHKQMRQRANLQMAMSKQLCMSSPACSLGPFFLFLRMCLGFEAVAIRSSRHAHSVLACLCAYLRGKRSSFGTCPPFSRIWLLY